MVSKDTDYLQSLYAYAVHPPVLMEKYYNDTLNEKFWVNSQFDPGVREKLLAIAKEFYNGLKLTVPVLDIQLTGSLANYNYTEYSDLDVHVIIDFKDISQNIDLVKQALDGMRFIWNIRHDITIRGHDVELYVQDVNEQHTASGLYSLLHGEWIRKPVYNPPEIDEKDVEVKFSNYVTEINKIAVCLKAKNLSQEDLKAVTDRAVKLKNKIQKDRKDCLQGGNEFCVENLVFKKLRGSGMLEKLIDVGIEAYDRAYSEDELQKHPNSTEC